MNAERSASLTAASVPKSSSSAKASKLPKLRINIPVRSSPLKHLAMRRGSNGDTVFLDRRRRSSASSLSSHAAAMAAAVANVTARRGSLSGDQPAPSSSLGPAGAQRPASGLMSLPEAYRRRARNQYNKARKQLLVASITTNLMNRVDAAARAALSSSDSSDSAASSPASPESPTSDVSDSSTESMDGSDYSLSGGEESDDGSSTCSSLTESTMYSAGEDDTDIDSDDSVSMLEAALEENVRQALSIEPSPAKVEEQQPMSAPLAPDVIESVFEQIMAMQTARTVPVSQPPTRLEVQYAVRTGPVGSVVLANEGTSMSGISKPPSPRSVAAAQPRVVESPVTMVSGGGASGTSSPTVSSVAANSDDVPNRRTSLIKAGILRERSSTAATDQAPAPAVQHRQSTQRREEYAAVFKALFSRRSSSLPAGAAQIAQQVEQQENATQDLPATHEPASSEAVDSTHAEVDESACASTFVPRGPPIMPPFGARLHQRTPSRVIKHRGHPGSKVKRKPPPPPLNVGLTRVFTEGMPPVNQVLRIIRRPSASALSAAPEVPPLAGLPPVFPLPPVPDHQQPRAVPGRENSLTPKSTPTGSAASSPHAIATAVGAPMASPGAATVFAPPPREERVPVPQATLPAPSDAPLQNKGPRIDSALHLASVKAAAAAAAAAASVVTTPTSAKLAALQAEHQELALDSLAFTGYLYQLNSRNQWQKRVFSFDGRYLVCLRKDPDAGKPAAASDSAASHPLLSVPPPTLMSPSVARDEPTPPQTPTISESGAGAAPGGMLPAYQPRWAIDLHQVVFLGLVKRTGSKWKNSFAVSTQARDYLLRATSAMDLRNWLFVLGKTMDGINRMRAALEPPAPESRVPASIIAAAGSTPNAHAVVAGPPAGTQSLDRGLSRIRAVPTAAELQERLRRALPAGGADGIALKQVEAKVSVPVHVGVNIPQPVDTRYSFIRPNSTSSNTDTPAPAKKQVAVTMVEPASPENSPVLATLIPGYVPGAKVVNPVQPPAPLGPEDRVLVVTKQQLKVMEHALGSLEDLVALLDPSTPRRRRPGPEWFITLSTYNVPYYLNDLKQHLLNLAPCTAAARSLANTALQLLLRWQPAVQDLAPFAGVAYGRLPVRTNQRRMQLTQQVEARIAREGHLERIRQFCAAMRKCRKEVLVPPQRVSAGESSASKSAAPAREQQQPMTTAQKRASVAAHPAAAAASAAARAAKAAAAANRAAGMPAIKEPVSVRAQ
ncbi:hypothetical protein H9P43_005774 [Blastocladiella emersonii ATCC 22665]|nr:hypothetical protein H9P43_005774 [Blastocladiella emersonii ATCC 22665]